GARVLASFAWTGHGAADDGTRGLVHLAGDIVHLLAAAVWLGALAALAMLLLQAQPTASPERLAALHGALEGFSGIGSAVVALLLASGLVNSWFLVDVARLGDLVRTPYGLVLTAKVAVFAGMLALAALNRFRLTPRLDRALGGGESLAPAIAALRRSLLLETSAGMAVLVLVSVLGALEPLTSS
ncbi:MAG TPA: copper homeostasis membrane protein CopD, partial [Caulobacteraceae bacterium]